MTMNIRVQAVSLVRRKVWLPETWTSFSTRRFRKLATPQKRFDSKAVTARITLPPPSRLSKLMQIWVRASLSRLRVFRNAPASMTPSTTCSPMRSTWTTTISWWGPRSRLERLEMAYSHKTVRLSSTSFKIKRLRSRFPVKRRIWSLNRTSRSGISLQIRQDLPLWVVLLKWWSTLIPCIKTHRVQPKTTLKTAILHPRRIVFRRAVAGAFVCSTISPQLVLAAPLSQLRRTKFMERTRSLTTEEVE